MILKLFILMTGMGDIGAGVLLFFPSIVSNFGLIPSAPGFWMQLVGLFLIAVGIMLVISLMDLEKRAFVVYWDGILRISAFFLFVYWGLFEDLGKSTVLIGLCDLTIGLVYCIGLPKVLNAKPITIMLGKNKTLP